MSDQFNKEENPTYTTTMRMDIRDLATVFSFFKSEGYMMNNGGEVIREAMRLLVQSLRQAEKIERRLTYLEASDLLAANGFKTFSRKDEASRKRLAEAIQLEIAETDISIHGQLRTSTDADHSGEVDKRPKEEYQAGEGISADIVEEEE